MIVFCEECGEKNNLENDNMDSTPGFINCSACGEVIKIITHRELKSRLVLKFRKKSIEMTNNRPVITMGRRSQNDIVIKNKQISRSHAVIVYLESKFMLIDLSKNGTYIQTDDNNEITIRQKRHKLTGSGIIYFTRKSKSNPSEIVSYSIIEKKNEET